ncbi:hypothetical protein B0I35DRAFT_442620 [Stachybotrys elegans]|uniref:Zn(2)-C6 fungal-type domain-containing protein n=1 Tax=Stachybotrys elegans TaxID=80388 RepID=A0A8K0SFJ5_9HYPO|nr:hypothetical protein B0I35DRAFT_442620 [Stachybotrys elegans]
MRKYLTIMGFDNNENYIRQACDYCKVQKRKCDRALPACSTCTNKFVKCRYKENIAQKEIRELRFRIQQMGCRSALLAPTSFNQAPSGPLIRYPIPSQWYMEFLLNHYCYMSFPSFVQSDPDTDHPFSKQDWIQASFSDPCMFHAILFAASSHLEMLRRENSSPVTNYHRHQVTSALVKQISSSAKVLDTSIAAALYLWHYEAMNNHMKEAQVHKRGVEQMVKAQGGLSNLSLGGYLAHLITLIDIGHAVLNASTPFYQGEAVPQSPEIPISMLSAISDRSDALLSDLEVEQPLVDLLRQVHHHHLEFRPGVPFKGTYILPATLLEQMLHDASTKSTLVAAMLYAVHIHLYTLQQRIPFTSHENQQLVEQLRVCLASLPPAENSELEAVIMVWLCFTGAATSRTQKAWFLAKVGPVLMSLGQVTLGIVKVGLVRFCGVAHSLASSKSNNSTGKKI